MTQVNPNCGVMTKDAQGYHKCMQAKGHAGPHKCSHLVFTEGMPLYKDRPQPDQKGHPQVGTFGKDGAVKLDLTEG